MSSKKAAPSTGVESSIKISVAIITRNRAELLKNCLLSLHVQSMRPYEVIVIDNASYDSTKLQVLSFKKSLPVRYFYESHIGVSHARNRAIKEARGGIVAFIDDDCEASKTWVQEIVEGHKKLPNAAAIVGKSYAISPRSAFGVLEQYYKDLWFLFNRHKNNLYIIDTMNVSIKMAVVKKLHISFQNSPFNMGEDVDFAKHILSKGQEIIYNAKARVFFRSRTNVWDFLKQRFFIGATNVFLEYKWNPSIPPGKKPFPRLTRETGKRLTLYQVKFLFLLHAISLVIQEFGRSFGLMKLFHDYRRLEKDPRMSKEIVNKRYRRLTLSVMIITKDRYKLLNQCLGSLVRQTKMPDQVVIVDSSSHVDTSFLKKFRKVLPITYIAERKSGYAIQRNIALVHATGDIVGIIDDDSVAAPQWCENIIQFHTSLPNVLAIQGKQVSLPKISPFAILEQIRRDSWILKNLDSQGNTYILADNNCSFKRKFLKRSGIQFADNTLYDTFGGLDVDLANQILLAKETMVYVPSILVYHWERSNVFSYLKQQYRISASVAIIQHDWGNIRLSKPMNIYQLTRNARFISEYLLNIILHPSSKKNAHLIPILLLLFCLTRIIGGLGFRYGKEALKKTFHLPSYLKLGGKVKAESFTVAIITRNRSMKLRRVLWSLLAQKILPGNIVIVDNASTDNTRRIVEVYKRYLPIRYLYESKIGIPYARNKALKEANTELLAFIDDDCVAPPDWVYSFMQANQQYPSVVAIQGQSISIPGRNVYSVIAQFVRHGVIGSLFKNRRQYFNLLLGKGKRNAYGIPIIDTRNVLLKLTAVRKLKITFDEHLQRGEDVDFGRQLKSLKKQILFYPKMIVYHYERDNFADFTTQTFKRGIGLARLERKWPTSFDWSKVTKLNLSSFVKHTKYYSISTRTSLLVVYLLFHYITDVGRFYEKLRTLFLEKLRTLELRLIDYRRA